MNEITLRIGLAWWVVPYILAVGVFARVFGMAPDYEKIARTVLKGIVVRPVRC